MRKGIFATVIFFIALMAGIKIYDLTSRYDLSIFEYVKYSANLSEEERLYLNNNTIKYGIDINDAPFAFVSDETGQNTGILIDYFNQLSVTLESNFQPEAYDSFNIALRLKDGDADAAVLNKTSLNERVFLYTQPLYTERSKILVGGDSEFNTINDVEGISIAVISGTTAQHAANEFFGSSGRVRLVLVEDLNECFYRFGVGEVDAILGDEAKISYYLNNGIRSNRFKFLEGSISEEDVAIAVNPEQTRLFNILNKGIFEMKRNNQYSHINSKWFGSFIPEIDESQSNGTNANIAIIIIALISTLLLWNATVQNRVTQRTRELAESRQELRELIDSLRDGILVANADDVVQVCNNSLLSFLGVGIDEVVGRRVTEIPQLVPFLEHAGGQSIYTKDDRDYLVYHRRMNVSSNDNLVFIDDYTDRHRYESLNSQEAKMIAIGELSAGLAHEIRNPLGLIKSYLYVLKKKIGAGDATGEHAIRVMDDSANRINQLIENLLGFSRLSMDRAEELDVREAVNSVLSLEKRRLEKNGIEMSVQFEFAGDGRLKLNGDVLKLSLVNLMNNAIDALLESGKDEKKIRIRLREGGRELRIAFWDNGTGIAQENTEAIFNPFYTTKESGTGLGLYILHSEIRGVGGKIEASSRYGEWTEFRMILPIESEEDDEK